MNDDYAALRALYRAARAEERPTHADRQAVRMALAAAATVGVQAATTGAAASIPSLSASVAAVGAKGIIPMLFGGKFLGGLVVGAAIGTAVSATAYVVDPPKPRAKVGVTTNRPLASKPSTLGARSLAATPVAVNPDVSADPNATNLAANDLTTATPALEIDAETRAESGKVATSDLATSDLATRDAANDAQVAAEARSMQSGSSVRAHAAQRKSSRSASDQLLQETTALAQVQSALNQKDPNVAIALLEQQKRSFSSGQLAEEREAAYVLALCAAKRTAEAEQARARFVTAHPNSPLVKRVKKSCDQP